jgi:hypothetical protein
VPGRARFYAITIRLQRNDFAVDANSAELSTLSTLRIRRMLRRLPKLQRAQAVNAVYSLEKCKARKRD